MGSKKKARAQAGRPGAADAPPQAQGRRDAADPEAAARSAAGEERQGNRLVAVTLRVLDGAGGGAGGAAAQQEGPAASPGDGALPPAAQARVAVLEGALRAAEERIAEVEHALAEERAGRAPGGEAPDAGDVGAALAEALAEAEGLRAGAAAMSEALQRSEANEEDLQRQLNAERATVRAEENDAVRDRLSRAEAALERERSTIVSLQRQAAGDRDTASTLRRQLEEIEAKAALADVDAAATRAELQRLRDRCVLLEREAELRAGEAEAGGGRDAAARLEDARAREEAASMMAQKLLAMNDELVEQLNAQALAMDALRAQHSEAAGGPGDQAEPSAASGAPPVQAGLTAAPHAPAPAPVEAPPVEEATKARPRVGLLGYITGFDRALDAPTTPR